MWCQLTPGAFQERSEDSTRTHDVLSSVVCLDYMCSNTAKLAKCLFFIRFNSVYSFIYWYVLLCCAVDYEVNTLKSAHVFPCCSTFLHRYPQSWKVTRAMEVVNDIKLWQMKILKRVFRSLIETVRSTSPAMRIIASGLLPMFRRGHERLSRLFASNE